MEMQTTELIASLGLRCLTGCLRLPTTSAQIRDSDIPIIGNAADIYLRVRVGLENER